MLIPPPHSRHQDTSSINSSPQKPDKRTPAVPPYLSPRTLLGPPFVHLSPISSYTGGAGGANKIAHRRLGGGGILLGEEGAQLLRLPARTLQMLLEHVPLPGQGRDLLHKSVQLPSQQFGARFAGLCAPRQALALQLCWQTTRRAQRNEDEVTRLRLSDRAPTTLFDFVSRVEIQGTAAKGTMLAGDQWQAE